MRSKIRNFLFFILAAGFLFGAFFAGKSALEQISKIISLISSGQKTEAKVLSTRRAGKGGRLFLLVEYPTTKGPQQFEASNSGVSANVGDSIGVIYNEEDPTMVAVDTFLGLYLDSILFVLLTIALIVIPLVGWRYRNHDVYFEAGSRGFKFRPPAEFQ